MLPALGLCSFLLDSTWLGFYLCSVDTARYPGYTAIAHVKLSEAQDISEQMNYVLSFFLPNSSLSNIKMENDIFQHLVG